MVKYNLIHYPPSIEYERGWDVNAKQRTVELKAEFTDDRVVTRKVAVQEDQHDVEHLVMVVYAEFNEVIEPLQLKNEELFEQMSQCLRGQFLSRYLRLIKDLMPIQRTTAKFKKVLDELVCLVTGPNPRDAVIEALNHGHYMKPKGVTPLKHHERISEIAAYATAVPGTESVVDAHHLKKMIVENNPRSFLKTLFLSGKDYVAMKAEDVTQFYQTIYMLENMHAGGQTKQPRDQPNNNSNKKSRRNNGWKARRQQDTRNGGQASNKFKFNKPSPTSPCPLHGPTHTWGECFDNRRGENYKPAANKSWTRNKNEKGTAKKEQYHVEDVEMSDVEGTPKDIEAHTNAPSIPNTHKRDYDDVMATIWE